MDNSDFQADLESVLLEINAQVENEFLLVEISLFFWFKISKFHFHVEFDVECGRLQSNAVECDQMPSNVIENGVKRRRFLHLQKNWLNFYSKQNKNVILTCFPTKIIIFFCHSVSNNHIYL